MWFQFYSRFRFGTRGASSMNTFRLPGGPSMWCLSSGGTTNPYLSNKDIRIGSYWAKVISNRRCLLRHSLCTIAAHCHLAQTDMAAFACRVTAQSADCKLLFCFPARWLLCHKVCALVPVSVSLYGNRSTLPNSAAHSAGQCEAETFLIGTVDQAFF